MVYISSNEAAKNVATIKSAPGFERWHVIFGQFLYGTVATVATVALQITGGVDRLLPRPLFEIGAIHETVAPVNALKTLRVAMTGRG